MSWRIGTAAVAALSLVILPLSIGSAQADDTPTSSPTSVPVPTESTTPTGTPTQTPSQTAEPEQTASSTPSETPATTDPAQADGSELASKTIMVTFDKAQADPAAAAEAVVAGAADTVAGAKVVNADPITDSLVAVTLDSALTTSQTAAVEDRLTDARGVKTAEVAGWFRPTTNDSDYGRLWNIAGAGSSVAWRTYGSHAEDAWSTTTGANAIVGVIDTGISPHPDLTASNSRIIGGNVIDGYDFISDACVAGDGGYCKNDVPKDGDNDRDANPTDTGDFYTDDEGFHNSSWHGTHVSGIIAALANNEEGVAGVAPNTKVEPLRALGRGGGLETDVIAAIQWGAGLPVEGVPTNPQPAQVLNLSLGESRPDCSDTMQDAIDAVTAKGVIVVVAAGNEGRPVSNSSPANCRNVISVGATTTYGSLASYSNYGDASQLTITAPGGGVSDTDYGVRSTINSGTTTIGTADYANMPGTSMAAPHVAATVALLKSMKPDLTYAEAKTILVDTADETPYCTRCGAGRLNTAAAVAALASSPGFTPASVSLQASAPTITGTPRVGQRLTVNASGGGSTLSYQWYRSGAKVAGATSSSYLLTASDKDKNPLVKVTATSGSQRTIRFSAETTTVKPGSFVKGTPLASGTPRVGKKLTVSRGIWSPSPSSFSYRWLRNGKSISGATKSTYKLTSKDRGKKISVRVTATKTGYTTTSATSSSRTVKR